MIKCISMVVLLVWVHSSNAVTEPANATTVTGGTSSSTTPPVYSPVDQWLVFIIIGSVMGGIAGIWYGTHCCWKSFCPEFRLRSCFNKEETVTVV